MWDMILFTSQHYKEHIFIALSCRQKFFAKYYTRKKLSFPHRYRFEELLAYEDEKRREVKNNRIEALEQAFVGKIGAKDLKIQIV